MSLDTLADFTIRFYIFHWIWPLYGPGNCLMINIYGFEWQWCSHKHMPLAHHVGSKNLRECPKFSKRKTHLPENKTGCPAPGLRWTSLDVSFRSRAANDIIVTKTMWFSQTSSTKCQLYPQILLKMSCNKKGSSRKNNLWTKTDPPWMQPTDHYCPFITINHH